MADRRRERRAWGALTAVVGGLAILTFGYASMPTTGPAAAPASSRPPRPPGALPVAAIVGDSIMHDLLSGPPTDAELSTTHEVRRVSVPGATVGELVDEVAAAVGDADVAVLEMGTNDAMRAGADVGWSTTSRSLDAVADLVDAVPCVVVVTVDEGMAEPGAAARAREIRAWWADRFADEPERHVWADWSSFVADNGGTGEWTTDDVHPTAAGSAAIASLVRSAVDRCP